MSSFNRYSHHARRALTHAAMLVTRYHHPRVDTGHLLVGVILARGSSGHAILQELELQAAQAESFLKTLTVSLDEPVEVPQNDAALDIALELAADESSWLGHHYVGTDHLLLGITRTNLGNASDLLHLLGVPPEQVRNRVRRALKEGVTEYSLGLARRSARLSELSRRVINAAEQQAVALDHQTVGLGHLLLVLALESRSSISRILRDHSLSPERVRELLDAEDENALVNLEGVLIQAGEYAGDLGSHYTGTEHLLLALSTSDPGAKLLEGLDLSPETLRDILKQQLRAGR